MAGESIIAVSVKLIPYSRAEMSGFVVLLVLRVKVVGKNVMPMFGP